MSKKVKLILLVLLILVGLLFLGKAKGQNVGELSLLLATLGALLAMLFLKPLKK